MITYINIKSLKTSLDNQEAKIHRNDTLIYINHLSA